MKKFFKDNLFFLLLFTIVFAGLGVALLLNNKSDLHIWLNSYHTSWSDFFFRYYTHIAEYGICATAFILLFWKLGASLYLLIGEAVGGITVQIMKHLVQSPRPKVFFDLTSNPDVLPLVEGVQLHSGNSFPSGHASSFFVLFFGLAIVLGYYGNLKTSQKKIVQVLCFLLAMIGAYSRVYLSQHFAEDIFAGCIIGVLAISLLHPAFVWVNKKYPKFCAWHIKLRAS